jgi:hypothetical protein
MNSECPFLSTIHTELFQPTPVICPGGTLFIPIAGTLLHDQYWDGPICFSG